MSRLDEWLGRIPNWFLYVIGIPLGLILGLAIIVLCIMAGGAFFIGMEELVEKIGERWTIVVLFSIWPLFIFTVWVIYKIEQKIKK